MRANSKLVMTLSIFVLVIFVLVTGVWAASTLNFNIGGVLKFQAKGINATISAGTLSSTGSFVNPSDATTKMKQIVLSTTNEDPNIEANLASWEGINLDFNSEGDDVTISFSIKNDAPTTSSETVYTKITVNEGEGATNATVSTDKVLATIAPQTFENFTITFKVVQKNLSAELSNFVITVELSSVPFQSDPV